MQREVLDVPLHLFAFRLSKQRMRSLTQADYDAAVEEILVAKAEIDRRVEATGRETSVGPLLALSLLIGVLPRPLLDVIEPDVVVTDMMLPDIDGLELLRRFKLAHPDTEVIVVTGHGSVQKAVEAMKAGAFEFAEKPIDADALLAKLERAIERRDLLGENLALKQKIESQFRFGNIIG